MDIEKRLEAITHQALDKMVKAVLCNESICKDIKNKPLDVMHEAFTEMLTLNREWCMLYFNAKGRCKVDNDKECGHCVAEGVHIDELVHRVMNLKTIAMVIGVLTGRVKMA